MGNFTQSLTALSLIILFGVVSSTEANEPLRPNSRAHFQNIRPQKHYRLLDAKVVWVDFARMRADFPPLQKLSDGDLENWILDEFAYISEQQLKFRGIRTSEFAYDSKRTKEFFHPVRYSRAAVAEANLKGQSIGLVDLKGTGHSEGYAVDAQVAAFQRAGSEKERDQLRIKDHSDGVSSLGENIAEVSKQNAVQAAYDIKGIPGETVECYFIIDTGFDILKDQGTRIPASIVGRQPHIRGDNWVGNAELVYSDDHGHFQRSVSQATVDFGGVVVTVPEAAENFKTIPGGNSSNPQDSLAWARGHDVAREFRTLSNENIFGARHRVYAQIESMLGGLAAPWKEVRWSKPALTPYERWRVALRNTKTIAFLVAEKPAADPEFRRALDDSLKDLKFFEQSLSHAMAVGIEDPQFYRKAYLEAWFPAYNAGKVRVVSHDVPLLISLIPVSTSNSAVLPVSHGFAAFTALKRARLPPSQELHRFLVKSFLFTSSRPDDVLLMIEGQALTTDEEIVKSIAEAFDSLDSRQARFNADRLVRELKLDHPLIREGLRKFTADYPDARGSAAIEYLKGLSDGGLKHCRTLL